MNHFSDLKISEQFSFSDYIKGDPEMVSNSKRGLYLWWQTIMKDDGASGRMAQAEEIMREIVDQPELFRFMLGLHDSLPIPDWHNDVDAFEELMHETGYYTKLRFEDAVTQFVEIFLVFNEGESYNLDDEKGLRGMWNDYTDSLCKEGDITDWQYHNWDGYDEDIFRRIRPFSITRNVRSEQP